MVGDLFQLPDEVHVVGWRLEPVRPDGRMPTIDELQAQMGRTTLSRKALMNLGASREVLILYIEGLDVPATTVEDAIPELGIYVEEVASSTVHGGRYQRLRLIPLGPPSHEEESPADATPPDATAYLTR